MILIILGFAVIVAIITVISMRNEFYIIREEDLEVYSPYQNRVKGSVRGSTGKTESNVVLEIRRRRLGLRGTKF